MNFIAKKRRLKKEHPLFLFLKEFLFEPWRAYSCSLCCHCFVQWNDLSKWIFWIFSQE